ncbi:MAG: caspase family protein [Bacteroidetes bacterium]|nr:caspase family protein [Bacteroidota bacterium]
MPIKTIPFFISSIIFAFASAQPQVEWEYSFGKSGYDKVYSVVSNSMSEYLIAGSTWNKPGENYDGLLIKLDFNGNKIWEKVYGAAGTEIITSVTALPAGGYLAAGYTSSKGAGSDDFWIIKVSESGMMEWERVYGKQFEDKARDIYLTKKGEILVTGQQMTQSSSTIGMWVMKLDSAGEMIWEKCFNRHFRCYGESVREVNDMYIITGYFEPWSSKDDEKYSDDKAIVLALDKNGDIVWEKIFGGEKEDRASSAVITGNNEIAVAGYTSSKGKGYKDVWLMKLNSKGEMIWEQTWGDISDDEANCIAETDGGLTICGSTSSRESNSSDLVLLRYSKNGTLLWSKVQPTDLNEDPSGILSTADGGLLVAAVQCTHYLYDSRPVKCKMYVAKFPGTPSKSIARYIDLKVKNWEKKGEFEKTDTYQKRVNTENRNKIIEKHRREAIALYASYTVNLKGAVLGNYNADNEEFTITVEGIGTIPVSVSIDNAQTFRDDFQNVQFENTEFAVSDEKFILKKAFLIAGGDEYTFNTSQAQGKFVKTGERKAAEPDPLFRGSGDPLKGLSVPKSSTIPETGKYFALIIGIDNYKGQWSPLNNAVRDAQALELLLKSKYRFDQIKTFYDEQATRENIITAMMFLAENVTETDNVLLFYSGHGEFNKTLDKGYWVPADAQTSSVAAFISNADIQTFLNGINSKHTLLISDACFSGDIFRGGTYKVDMETPEKYFAGTYNLKSRQALTSGGVEPVMDGGKDGHSVFAYYFLNTLQSNENLYLDASRLFDKIKIPVTNNSEQTPILQSIKNTGDEGGQFIFIRK